MKTASITPTAGISGGTNNDVSREGKIPPAHGVEDDPCSTQPVFTTRDLQILISGNKFLLDYGHTARIRFFQYADYLFLWRGDHKDHLP
jgi:hypothetical protein